MFHTDYDTHEKQTSKDQTPAQNLLPIRILHDNGTQIYTKSDQNTTEIHKIPQTLYLKSHEHRNLIMTPSSANKHKITLCRLLSNIT